jgi:excisionase family DNA binding protein
MKRFLVEARLTYEIEAPAADDALRLLSASINDHNAVNVEYLIRPQLEVAPPALAVRADNHGLDKPVYTVAEVASVLGSSRGSVYELVRRGIKSIRMGRRVLIPRGTVASILNGEVGLNEREASPPPPPPRRRPQRVREPERAEIIPPVRERAKREPTKPKPFVSVTEAARMLRMPAPKLRELMAQRKIFYSDDYGKQRIPLQAIENFANGLPAVALLEQNIAAHRAEGPLDDEMEAIAQKLLAEWRVSDDS